MRLLFDENLSERLVRLVTGRFPRSEHVRAAGLKGALDDRIWERARLDGCAIVSKDTDFRDRALLEGAPPKVIWLDVGNAGTQAIGELLLREHGRIDAFARRSEESLLILSLGAGSL